VGDALFPEGRRPDGAGTRRRTAIALVALAAVVLLAGVMVARRGRREALAQEMLIVQGVRKVCKLATVEITLADYARRRVPKTIDLPFTSEPEAYIFYSGVASAGFDACDEPWRIDVDHTARVVHLRLPPARLLSLDMKRFETINESSGFLNAIAPEDRNRWFQEARTSLEKAAVDEGALPKAEAHARELFGELAARFDYRLDLQVEGSAGRPGPEKLVPARPSL
jgi:hypothetical protein